MTTRIGILASLLLSLAAYAQEELGLDLSAASTPEEFRPSFAFVGVTAEGSDETVVARAKLLETELLKLVQGNDAFGSVKTPDEVVAVVSTARKCTEMACFVDLGNKLGVFRIINARITQNGPSSVLTMQGFDTSLPGLLPSSVESGERQEKAQIGGFSGIAGKSRAQRDKEFVTRAKTAFNELLKNLGTPLGKIAVDVMEPKAVTRIKGLDVGTGSFEKAFPAGTYEIEVSSDEYLPFSSKVTVEPLKTADVKVTLVARPLDRDLMSRNDRSNAPPIYKRPGLYIALAGAAMVGVGLGLGASAKSIENRAVDGDRDGYIDITRAQAESAKTSALLANVFVSAGAVAIVGGGIWAFVVPLFSKGSTNSAAPLPSDYEGAGFGFVAAVGGKF